MTTSRICRSSNTQFICRYLQKADKETYDQTPESIRRARRSGTSRRRLGVSIGEYFFSSPETEGPKRVERDPERHIEENVDPSEAIKCIPKAKPPCVRIDDKTVKAL